MNLLTLPLGVLFRTIARFIGLLLPRQFCQFRLGRQLLPSCRVVDTRLCVTNRYPGGVGSLPGA